MRRRQIRSTGDIEVGTCHGDGDTHFAHEMCTARVHEAGGAEALRRVGGGWHYSAGFAQCSAIFVTACSSESMATSLLDR